MNKSVFRSLWQWLTHDFFKISAGLFGLGLLGTALNMVCRWILGRMMTPEQYGEMETVVQAGGYIGVPLSSLSIILIREVAFARGAGDLDRMQAVIWTLGRLVVGYAFFGMALMLALSPLIRDWFHFNSIWPAVATSTIGVTGCIMAIVSGTLQGSHRFWQGGFMGVCGPIAKIAFSWILISTGFGATGAVAAQSASNAVMGLVGLYFAWPLLFPWRNRTTIPLGGLFRYFIPITLTLWVAAVFSGIDMVFVKRAFSALDAGNYARVSSLAKLSLFINGMLTITLFPWVASEQAGGRGTRHLLGRALTAGAGIAVVSALAFTAIPGFLLGIFYKQVTADMILWARLLGWALIPGSLFNILIQYFMARQEYGFLKWLAPAGALYVILLLLFRHSIISLILAMGAGSLVLVLVLTWLALTGRWMGISKTGRVSDR